MSNPLPRFSLVAGTLALLCAAALGCSISYSFEKSSDSSAHSSDSSAHSSTSSGSSSGEEKKPDSARFEQDVEQYTVAFLEAGGREDESFFSGLGELARQHGVSDWESEPATWEAIGSGLAHSKASAAERLAYQTAWAGGDTAKQSAMAKGISTAQ